MRQRARSAQAPWVKPWMGGLTVPLLLLLLLLAGPVTAQEGPPNRAGLVVRFGDGRVVTRCVPFSEPTISGYDLLERSGLGVVIAYSPGLGGAVCQIGGQGCPAEDCFCAYPPDFWSYWYLAEGGWRFSPVGAAGRQVRPGDVDGWSWGPGTAQGGAPPPVIPFEQICGPSPAATEALPPTPTLPPPPPTETPTRLPSPTPPATPEPTVTVLSGTAPLERAGGNAAPTSSLSPTSRSYPPAPSPTLPPSPASSTPPPSPTTLSSPTPSPRTGEPSPSPTYAPPPAGRALGRGAYLLFGAIVLGLIGMLLAIRRGGER